MSNIMTGERVLSQPFVSIVIPTYNRLYQLAELVEALSRQTYKNFEVIIVNDCGEKVDVLQEVYPDLNLVIVELGENSKHVLARNQGVLRAKGEFIMLIDDDDLIIPTHLETMVGAIEDYDLVYSDVEIVNFAVEHQVRVAASRFLFAYEMDLEAMRSFSTYVPSGSLYRRELHQTLGLFDPDVHNYWDWDFFLRVAENHRVHRVAKAGVLYDFSDANNNQSKDPASRRDYLDKLSEKHQLGSLPTKNFFQLLEQPEVKQRQAESHILWDGQPFRSRLIG
ncbi:glycosyltransferase family 2 protein [Bacillus salipaludis]|uniref:Glycosyltransferase family 2 protein n=1 Tax=Bacillus salipaludis TaxID=2547811 RepID=A0AA90R1Y4_9BACI|nr:glycosyltransferase family 2 protein [Bacillus salipaludis]MDQ6600504.1 glycosyltransferase family 2 protein [Bacillus salipaludis]